MYYHILLKFPSCAQLRFIFVVVTSVDWALTYIFLSPFTPENSVSRPASAHVFSTPWLDLVLNHGTLLFLPDFGMVSISSSHYADEFHMI